MEGGDAEALEVIFFYLLRLLIGGLPLKLLAVEALFEIFVGITAEFRESRDVKVIIYKAS